MKVFISTVFFLVCCCLVNAIGIYPVRFEVEARPGVDVFKQVKLQNDQKVPVKVFLSSREWKTVFGEIKHSDIEPVWLGYDSEPFILEPGASKVVSLNIKVPEGLKGEKAAHLYVKYVAKKTNYASQVGIPLYLMSTKGIKKKIYLKKAFIEKQGDKTLFFVTIKNKGNVHFRPSVFLRIKKKGFDRYIQVKGKEIFKVANDWPVMAYESKTFSGEVKGLKLEPNEEYEAEFKVVYVYRNQPEKEESRKVKVKTK